MNLPNVLSLSRFPLGAAIAYAAAQHNWTLAFVLLLIAGVTDALDGMVAKQRGQCTALGDFLDMVGDLAMTVGAVIGLYLTHHLSLRVLIVAGLVLAAVQVINSFFRSSVLFTRFGLWFMPCYFLIVLWLLIGRYAMLALEPLAFEVFVPVFAAVTLWLIWLKRVRFKIWFSGVVPVA